MRIGIYLGDIKKPSSVGGLTFELSFVDELLKQETNHEFIFYYLGKKNIFKNKNNCTFKNIRYYKKPEITYNPLNIKTSRIPFLSLNYILKKDNIDFVYFLTPYLHQHIEIPYFAAIRDVAHRILPHFPEFSTNSIFEKKDKKLNLFLTSASKIITCNQVAKDDIRTLYNIIDENIQTQCLPYPNWIENINCDNENILKKNFLIKNGYILYPAQFWAHKNHIRLVLSALVMKEQNINLKVVFTGQDRGNLNYLKHQVKNYDLKKDIIFLNYVTSEELAVLYKNAYAMVYPCLAGADSISALEAMFFNCPVLISDHLGYRNQLKKAALYFNPLDEIDIVEKIKMLNNIAIKDDIVSKGKFLIQECNYKNYIDKILNLIDNFYLTRQCWSLGGGNKSK